MIRDDFLRWYGPLYLALYGAVCVVWRGFIVWRRTGVLPLALGRSDSIYDYVGRWFKFMLALVVVSVAAFTVPGRLYNWLLPIPYLEIDVLRTVGLGLTLVALAWVALAQAQMGASWRIGIAQDPPTPLVIRGLFAYSRNPIFLGVIVTLVAVFLLLPNAVSLLTLVLGYLLVQIQVRLEEDFLTHLHGEAYRSYCRRVRRWL